MARLNSRRSRAAKRRAALNALAKARNWTLQVETGNVRDSVVSKQHITSVQRMAAPRFAKEPTHGMDVQPRKGRIVDGHFKPPLPPKRFT